MTINISTKSKVRQCVPYLPQPTQIKQWDILSTIFTKLCRDKFGEDLGNFVFENWSCFLDDCETLLEKNKINLNDLLNILNSINSSIQFTMEYNKDAIPFLDILIKRSNDKIWMDIYYKPTGTHRCLPFSSNRPKHCVWYQQGFEYSFTGIACA